MSQLTLDTLLRYEHLGWDALCASTGGAFYGALMTGSAVMVLVDGTVLDRDAVVASLDGAPAWDDYRIDEPRLVTINPEAAALVYRATATRGHEAPFQAVMTSVYVREGEDLRLILYQQTTATH